jgi:NAD(P)-dependent dehydrogenase (short-subunit alcohol dehydrogenase family)
VCESTTGLREPQKDMTNTDTFETKVALVTGGSRGIGYAVAEALAARGTAVVITGLDGAKLSAARDRLAGKGARVEAVRADVRELADVRHAVQRALDRFGGLDILVNNAGVGRFVDIADMSDDDWHDVIATNLTGVFYCCRECVPHMRARGGGWILNISSLAGHNWFAKGGAYCASKAGLNALSEALMQEVRHDGIRVSYVMPGSVDTDFGGDRPRDAGWKLASEDVARVVVDLISHDPRSLPSRVEIRPSKPPRR